MLIIWFNAGQMDLLTYLRTLSVAELEAFALAVGTTVGHLRNIAYKARKASAALAMQIEIESKRAVSRRDLRPADWHLIWGSDDDASNHVVKQPFTGCREIKPELTVGGALGSPQPREGNVN